MPRQYPPGFRDELVQRMLDGEPVLSVRDDTGVPEQTLHRWKHQGLMRLPPFCGHGLCGLCRDLVEL